MGIFFISDKYAYKRTILFRLHYPLRRPKAFASICRQLHSASSIRPRTFSAQYTYLASPIRRLLLSGYMLLSRFRFCAIHGRCLTRIPARHCL